MAIRKKEFTSYRNHLFDDTTDGFVQVFKLDNGKIITRYTEANGLNVVLEEVENDLDTFITPNTMYIPKRRVNNIRQFRALYIDIDNSEGDTLYKAYKVLELAEKGKIPKPSMIVDSGRGIHLYWRIKNAPYGALHTWQELEDFLYVSLKYLGADVKATDAARVLRLPGTTNSRNNTKCRVIYTDDKLEYSMYDLREKYLKTTKKQLEMLRAKKKPKKKVIVNTFFNSYSLHMARAEDIETLCELRNYDVKGYRNMIIHCYAYWRGLIVRDLEQLAKEVYDLNNAFKVPLSQSHIEAVLRCVPNAIDKFMDYEVAIKNELMEKPKKNDRNKKGYWYKNSTLIDRLDITENEQQYLRTIISTDEKYKRRRVSDNEYQKAKQKAKYRDENGLTKTEVKRRDQFILIARMELEGMSLKSIAKELRIDLSNMSKRMKKKFDKINYSEIKEEVKNGLYSDVKVAI
ncbi:DNA-binding response regulator [Clostridium perfringens]|nr:DNA-binding response regulator [Clostridium perfringens]MDK0758143.1 DNA-binding response regulator [Clostridium perfringens]MDK0977717.1 DNA-binding response regulator [Clostridium perfringens]